MYIKYETVMVFCFGTFFRRPIKMEISEEEFSQSERKTKIDDLINV